MNTSGSGGFILHAIKVYVPSVRGLSRVDSGISYNDENANAITSHRRPKASANNSNSGASVVVVADVAMADADAEN